MSKPKRDLLSPGMEAAIEAVLNGLPKTPSKAPEDDLRLLVLRQLHALNRQALNAAREVESVATRSRQIALAAFEETRVRLMLLEEELGLPDEDEIQTEDDYEEHA